jgi:hypothetical protein
MSNLTRKDLLADLDDTGANTSNNPSFDSGGRY